MNIELSRRMSLFHSIFELICFIIFIVRNFLQSMNECFHHFLRVWRVEAMYGIFKIERLSQFSVDLQMENLVNWQTHFSVRVFIDVTNMKKYQILREKTGKVRVSSRSDRNIEEKKKKIIASCVKVDKTSYKNYRVEREKI